MLNIRICGIGKAACQEHYCKVDVSSKLIKDFPKMGNRTSGSQEEVCKNCIIILGLERWVYICA